MTSAARPSPAVEREVKMTAPAHMVIPDLGGAVLGGSVSVLSPQRLTAVYYDTADLRLARWGVTLRHRSERTLGAKGSAAVASWTLKLPVTDARPEATLPAHGLARREINLGGAAGVVPPALAGLVVGLARASALVPVAWLCTDRARHELRARDGQRVVEVDDDEVSVLVARPNGRGRRRAGRFREIEAELADGADALVLRNVVACIRAAGAGTPDPTPKLVRALGDPAADPPDVAAEVLGRHSTLGEVVVASLAGAVARLILADPGVRLGEDTEEVHRARVATRRLRSDLRTFGSVVDGAWARGLREDLGWLADVLGAARDADVLLSRLGERAAELPAEDAAGAASLLAELERQRAQRRRALIAAMASPRYLELLDRLVAAAAAPRWARSRGEAGEHDRSGPRPLREATAVVGGPAGSPALAATAGPSPASDPATPPGLAPPAPGGRDREDRRCAPAADVLPKLVARPWRQLATAVAHLGSSPTDEALHAVRIRAKRCRYAAEAAAPVIGPRATRFAARVADLQGVLGDGHDAVAAETWLRMAARHLTAAEALVAGELVAAESDAATRSRARWAKAWKKASQKRVRSWLDG